MELNELKALPVRSLYENLDLARQKYEDHCLFAFERSRADYEITYNEFIQYLEEENRPQVTADVDFENGTFVFDGDKGESLVLPYQKGNFFNVFNIR